MEQSKPFSDEESYGGPNNNNSYLEEVDRQLVVEVKAKTKEEEEEEIAVAAKISKQE